MKTFCLLFLLFTVNAGAQKKDVVAIKNTITQLFEQFSLRNAKDLQRYCTDDIQILENGEVWNLDTLATGISRIKDADYKRVNAFTFITITVDGNRGWTSYYNEARITKGGQQFYVKWLETAILKKRKGVWKIAVLHSTTIERKKL